MSLETVVLAAAVVLVAGAAVTSLAAYWRFRAPRVVTCPANGRRTAVTLDARYAALTAATGLALRVEDCAFWPGRARCGQACLDRPGSVQDATPLVRRLGPWYRGRKCVLCHGEFRELSWSTYPPTLMDAQGRRRAWFELTPEAAAAGIAAGEYRPVCWRCHVLEGLRQEEAQKMAQGPASA